jgi:hypothetical protein
MITDNAIIAFECLHAIQQGATERNNFCAYKLDLSKAYDRVDWSFLEKVLVRLGFQSEWGIGVMSRVTTVRYSVCLNGVPLESFQPSRGLHQGDPLSPYLFLLVADALSSAIQKDMQDNVIEELRISRNSHLLFADDALLFFKANTEQATNVRNLTTRFERGMGQLLSPEKCSLLVSRITGDPEKR